MIVHGLSLLVRMLRFRKLWWCEWILSMSWREMDVSLGGNGWRVCTLLDRSLDTARTSSMGGGEKRSARRIAGVERLAGPMVLFRGIDRKCAASTGSSGEVEESVKLSHHSMTEGSVRARDGVEGWGEMLLQ